MIIVMTILKFFPFSATSIRHCTTYPSFHFSLLINVDITSYTDFSSSLFFFTLRFLSCILFLFYSQFLSAIFFIIHFIYELLSIFVHHFNLSY